MEDERDVNAEQLMERLRETIRRTGGSRQRTGQPRFTPSQDAQVTADLDFLGAGHDIRDIPLVSHRRVTGALVIAIKDALRKLLAPILERQVAFNAAVARTVSHTRDKVSAFHDYQSDVTAAFERRFAALENRATARATQRRGHARRLDLQATRLDALERRLDSVASRLAARDDRVDCLASSLPALEQRLNALDGLPGELRAGLETVPGQLQEDLRGLRAALTEDIAALQARLEAESRARQSSTDGEIAALQARLEAESRARQSSTDGEIAAHSRALQALGEQWQALREHYQALSGRHHALAERHQVIRQQLAAAERKLRRLLAAGQAPVPEPDVRTAPMIVPAPLDGAPLDPDFDYAGFEERFRGSPEEVTAHQRMYVERFRDKGPVLDLGCGRGEFLQLLREAGIEARGVDIDLDMVLLCHEQGFDVVAAEGLAHLAELPDHSLGGIFAAQVVEHLTPQRVIALVKLCRQKLVPEGVLVVETPNPTCLMVFADSFYKDPSHIRPLHPDMLKFLLEATGFYDVEIVFSAPVDAAARIPPLEMSGVSADFNHGLERLNALLYGFQDYAVIGRTGR